MSAVRAVPLFRIFLSRAMDSTALRFAVARNRAGFRDNITFRGRSVFREISEGRLMDLFCGRLCGFSVAGGSIEMVKPAQYNRIMIHISEESNRKFIRWYMKL